MQRVKIKCYSLARYGTIRLFRRQILEEDRENSFMLDLAWCDYCWLRAYQNIQESASRSQSFLHHEVWRS